MKFRFLQIVCLSLVAMTLLTSGCSSFGKKKGNNDIAPVMDARLDTILRKNLTATGGVALWQGATCLKVNSISTLVTGDYGKMLTNQLISVGIKTPSEISITSELAQGDLIEVLSPLGEYSASDLALGEAGQHVKNAAQRLCLVSQAITQSSGLFSEKLQIRYIGEERRGGRKNHKVEVIPMVEDLENPGVISKGSDKIVLWINAETYFVNKIWFKFKVTGEDRYDYLGCNLRNYEEQPHGFVLPTYIGLVSSDKHQQFSEHEAYRIEAQNYEVVMRDATGESK